MKNKVQNWQKNVSANTLKNREKAIHLFPATTPSPSQAPKIKKLSKNIPQLFDKKGCQNAHAFLLVNLTKKVP